METSSNAAAAVASVDTLDLDELEAQTLDILHRYGSPKAKSLQKIGPAVRPRPLTGASTSNNRSCSTSAGIVKPNRVAGSRPLTAASRKHALRDAASSALNPPSTAPPYVKPSHLIGGKHTSEWDSVPSLLASGKTNNARQSPPRTSPFLNETPPYSVPLLGGPNKAPTPKPTAPARLQVPTECKFDPGQLKSLSLRDIKYTGFDKGSGVGGVTGDGDQAKGSLQPERECCFNCWSAGQSDQCVIHTDTQQNDAAEQQNNLSMCSSWGTNRLRRKYRSEEIHERLAETSDALVFDSSQNEFTTVEQPKHPIYRLVSQHLVSLNFTNQRRQRVRLWFQSFIKRLKDGKYESKRSNASAKLLLLRSTIKGMGAVRMLSNEVKDRHPQPPVTGTTVRERLGHEQILVEKSVASIDGVEETRSFVLAGPAPVPKALYQPREYEPLPQTTIVLKNEEETNDGRLDFSSIMSRSVTYATFSSKRTNENVAVGGLSGEVLVSRRFTGRFPPQYKNFTCSHDVVLVPPNVDEDSPTFPTLVVPPGELPYIRRELVTPLDNRRQPTVMVKTGLTPNDKHFFGLNRPEQTGETDDFGFRTSTWCELPIIDDTIDTQSFRPSESIATPNTPVLSAMRTMKVDASYPFRQEQSRTNCVEDLFHFLLSDGASSSNKLQVFTCIASQQCGFFLRNGDGTLPIGRVVTKVVRSLSFLQSESEEHAVYKEEQLPLGEGGVLLKHRPRHAECMPGGALISNSRSQVREAILRRMPEEGSSIECALPRPSSQRRKPVAGAPSVEVAIATSARSPVLSVEVSQKSPPTQKKSHSSLSLRSDAPISRRQSEPRQGSVASAETARKETTVVADSISHVIGETLKSFSAGSPEDLIRLGMGLGASLGAQGFLNLSASEQGNTVNEPNEGAAPENDDSTQDVSMPELDLHGIEDIHSCTSEESKLDDFPVDGNDLEDNIVNYADLRPSPQGLLDEVAATRVGRKRVEYLPYTYSLNLPTPSSQQPCKPRSMAEEWKENDDYNPWTATRDSTSSVFIRSLTLETKNWPQPDRIDGPATNNVKDLKTLFTLCRHGKYTELNDLVSSSSWTLPINYADDSGNTLLHIACQNGNKRIAKLCLRRGADSNARNLNGNSCLHFAFGYGFSDLGDYIVSKGADDSLRNAEGLTAYEFGADSELES
ncbi:hypothetical protein ACHAXT_006046 [Thalassiosira profunda]